MTGIKLSLLDLGRMEVDDGFFIRGRNAAATSDPHPRYDRRQFAIMAAVIEHPAVGPILFDSGCRQHAKDEWPEQAWDLFPMSRYEEEHHLDRALGAAGYGVDEIKAVVISHLHLDHAGGLEHFRGTDVPIYAHKLEIKSTTTPLPPERTSALIYRSTSTGS